VWVCGCVCVCTVELPPALGYLGASRGPCLDELV
jgi:hypothetical protein